MTPCVFARSHLEKFLAYKSVGFHQRAHAPIFVLLISALGIQLSVFSFQRWTLNFLNHFASSEQTIPNNVFTHFPLHGPSP